MMTASVCRKLPLYSRMLRQSVVRQLHQKKGHMRRLHTSQPLGIGYLLGVRM